MTHLCECEVDIDWDFDYLNLYEKAADTVLDAEKCPYECSVSLLITDDENIRQINKDNRDIDKPTDVLSFPMIDFKGPGEFASMLERDLSFDPYSGELLLGDIVLSKDRIEAQAIEYGHDIQREYAFLIVHSMLHLCGYDHIKEADRELMESRQKEIMQLLYNDFPKLKV